MQTNYYHLAQLNIARAVAPLDDPRLADFMAQIDDVNRLADQSPGFVWRLQSDSGNATDIQAFDDPFIIINMSVWESIAALHQYTYRSGHAAVFRRRKDWFEFPKEAHMVLWWVPARHIPTVIEGKERLDQLRQFGPGPEAFSFKQAFPKPE